MRVGGRGDLAASGRSDQEFAAEEIGLDLVLQGIDGDVHGGGQGLDAGRPAGEDADERFQIAPVLLVEAFGVDFLHGSGRRARWRE